MEAVSSFEMLMSTRLHGTTSQKTVTFNGRMRHRGAFLIKKFEKAGFVGILFEYVGFLPLVIPTTICTYLLLTLKCVINRPGQLAHLYI
jgi:hypothetical protein